MRRAEGPPGETGATAGGAKPAKRSSPWRQSRRWGRDPLTSPSFWPPISPSASHWQSEGGLGNTAIQGRGRARSGCKANRLPPNDTHFSVTPWARGCFYSHVSLSLGRAGYAAPFPFTCPSRMATLLTQYPILLFLTCLHYWC